MASFGLKGKNVWQACALGALLFLPQGVQAQRSIPGDFAPGDGVRVVAWQNPGIPRQNVENLGLSADYIIDRRGRVFLPLIGYVRAVGLRREALADTLGKRIRKYATGVEFVCKPLIRLTVLGAVNRPGSYLVEPDVSLWQAIDDAGGPITTANLEKMYYTRQGQVVAKELLGQFERAYTIEEIGIRTGDQLVIPNKSSFQFRTFLQMVSVASSLTLLYLRISDRQN